MVNQRPWRVRNIVIAASGNFLEMFDFMVFGFYATGIAQAYFPSGDAYASLLLALATFGAGFIMRPVGAIVLGTYMDRHGRRAGLILTLGLMSIGTLAIAALPGYLELGLAAPLLVLVARLLQGLSAGAEVGGVSVYLAEMATRGHKGFFVRGQSASQQLAVAFAAVLGVVMASTISPAAMLAWGWRIPFLIGCLLIPFIFLARRALPESPAFESGAPRLRTRQLLGSIARHWPVVLLGTMLAIMTTVSFYLITAYTPTFGTTVLHLSARDGLTVSLCVGLFNFAMLPVMGALSDRIGRHRQLIVSALLAMISGYPVLEWLVEEPSFARLLSVELWIALVYAAYNGAMIVYLTEIMPAAVRTSGFSLAYGIATALFGGFTPAICTYLIHLTGNRAMPGAWLSLAAAIGLTASLLLLKVEPTTANH